MKLLSAGIAGAAAGLALLLTAVDARGAGYSVARFGGEHGHPTTTNATAIFYNPAGIAMSEGFHVFLDGNFAWRYMSYQHSAQPSDDDASLPGANTGENSLFNVIASPMVGVTGKFGDFALGAGFYTPFGGQASWDRKDEFKDHPNYAGPYDGVQRWYAISGEIRSSFITLAAAYHIVPARLAIGIGGNLILSKTNPVRAKTSQGTNELSDEGRSHLDVSGTDWSLGIGLLYEAIEKQLWLGASYQSRPNFSGMKPQEGTFRFVGAKGTETTNSPAKLDTDLPDSIRVGARYRPADDLELRLFGDYIRWSVLERHCVYNPGLQCEPHSNVGGSTFFDQPRNWNDTFGVRAGISKWLSEPVEVFTGIGYASNAVPDETLEPSLADWHAISVAVGGRFELMDKIFLATSYTQLFYPSRDSTGKFNLDDPRPGDASRNPDAGGKYKQMVGVLNVNLDLAF
jgi:long-chain fatty acid transport protein